MKVLVQIACKKTKIINNKTNMTHNFNLTDLEKESIYAIVVAIAVDIDKGEGDYNLMKQLLKHIYQDETQRKGIIKFIRDWPLDDSIEANIGINAEEFFAINGDFKEIQELFTRRFKGNTLFTKK